MSRICVNRLKINGNEYEWISLFNENIKILGACWTLWNDCNEFKITESICSDTDAWKVVQL